MSKFKVDISGIDTSKLVVLKFDEMQELFKNIKNDPNARNKLIVGNLKLVLSSLQKFVNRTDNLDDLFQIGVIGLVKAIDNFDLSYNVKFSTYAVPMIIGEIKRHLRDDSTIRISRSVKDIAYKTLKIKEEKFLLNGKEPTLDTISKEIGVDEFEIVNAINATKPTKSIFEPIYDDGGETIYLLDQIENPKETSTNWNNRILLEDAIGKLKEKEKTILLQRYIQGKTQMEISDELNISQAQVSRIEKNALSHIKKLSK